MMNSVRLKYILFIFLIAISGCRKDEKTETPVVIDPTGDPTIEVISGITGFVTNENGDPISDAKVTVYNQEVTTDKNGVFYVNNVGLSRSNSNVKVERSGYFDGFKSFEPSLGGKSFVHLKMVSSGEASGFLSSEGGTVTMNGGARLSIPSNSIVVKDGGAPYEGTVVVYSHWYDPNDNEVGFTMPGNLLGLTKEEVEVQLGTYGMMAIELNSAGLEPLQLAPNSKATLYFPVSEILEPIENVPLWSFDEIDGVWVEEGVAVLEDGFYKAEVSHFSFWNCDAPFPLVNIVGQLTYQDFPVANIAIEVLRSDLSTGFGYTDIDGVFRGKVPKGENLLLKVIHCGEVLFSEEIGAFESDKDIGEIEVELANFNIRIQGRMLDCMNQTVENAYGVVRSGEDIIQIITPQSDGTFMTVILGCQNDNYSLQFINLEDFKKSEIILLDQSIEILNLEDVSICDENLEYIEITKEGKAPIFLVDDIKVYYSNEENLIIRVASPFIRFDIDLKVLEEGEFTPYNVLVEEYEGFGVSLLGGCGYSENEQYSCDEFEVQITKFDDFIEGTFSGFLGENRHKNFSTDPEYQEYFYSGSFRLKINESISTGEITGRLWFDDNNNNLRDPNEENETPIMRADLIKIDGYQYPIFAPTLYIYNDTYRFTNVIFGSYNVSILGGSGYTAVDMNAGSDDIDSDFSFDNNGTFISDDILMEVENTISNVDLGLEIPESVLCEELEYFGCAPNITVRFGIISGLPPFLARINDGPLVPVNNFGSFVIEQGGDVVIEVFDSNDNSCSSSGFIEDYSSNRVTGFVWRDLIDGTPNIRDDEEVGVDELLVSLYSEDGNIEFEEYTSDGNYSFDGVGPGHYYVRIEVPGFFELVTQNTTIDSGSDLDPNTAESELFLIEGCDDEIIIDAGLKSN